MIALPDRVGQSLKCLSADPEVASLTPVRYHTFVEIDLEMISWVILLPSAASRRVVVGYKRKNVHEVRKAYQGINVVRRTDRPDMTIAVDWDVKHHTKQTKHKLMFLYQNFYRYN